MGAVNAAQCQENLLSNQGRVVRDNERCVLTTKRGTPSS